MKQINELKELVISAQAEANDACLWRGAWIWKKREHEWKKWEHTINQAINGSLVGLIYVRTCKHCGNEQFMRKRV